MNLKHDFFQISKFSEVKTKKIFTNIGRVFPPSSGVADRLQVIQMQTRVKLLGGMQSNYWGDISPLGFGTSGCEPEVISPTKISPNWQSILDHIYNENSMLNEIVSLRVMKFDISNLDPTIIKLKSKTHRKVIARPLVRKIVTHKIEKFGKEPDKNPQKQFKGELMHKNTNKIINCVKTVTDNIFPQTRVPYLLDCKPRLIKLFFPSYLRLKFKGGLHSRAVYIFFALRFVAMPIRYFV